LSFLGDITFLLGGLSSPVFAGYRLSYSFIHIFNSFIQHYQISSTIFLMITLFTSKHDNSGQSFISCILCTVGILYGCTSASLLALCLFCPIYLIPCRFSLQLYSGLFPRYCLFGCRDSLRFHCFQPSFLWSFSFPVLPQLCVLIFFRLLVLVCRQSYHYHAHLAHGVHI